MSTLALVAVEGQRRERLMSIHCCYNIKEHFKYKIRVKRETTNDCAKTTILRPQKRINPVVVVVVVVVVVLVVVVLV